jgi:hypothetical protein
LETLQTDLDEYMNRFNNEKTPQGKRCKGRTPIATVLDGWNYAKKRTWLKSWWPKTRRQSGKR